MSFQELWMKQGGIPGVFVMAAFANLLDFDR